MLEGIRLRRLRFVAFAYLSGSRAPKENIVQNRLNIALLMYFSI